MQNDINWYSKIPKMWEKGELIYVADELSSFLCTSEHFSRHELFDCETCDLGVDKTCLLITQAARIKSIEKQLRDKHPEIFI